MIKDSTYYPHGITVTSQPAEEPITAAEVKLHTKVSTSADDTLIDMQIKAAREYVESLMGVALVTQTIQEVFNGFPVATYQNERQVIRLNRYPISSVTSVVYNDENGDDQTFSSSKYTSLLTSRPPVIALAQSESWPDVRNELGTVTITYVAGYGAKEDVPSDIKQALLLIVANWYDNREDSVSERMTAANRILTVRRGFFF